MWLAAAKATRTGPAPVWGFEKPVPYGKDEAENFIDRFQESISWHISLDFNSVFPEPSALVGFSQNNMIRDAENRDEESLGKALEDPASRYLRFCGRQGAGSQG